MEGWSIWCGTGRMIISSIRIGTESKYSGPRRKQSLLTEGTMDEREGIVELDTPGRAGNEHAWRDTATPEAIRNAIREENQRYGDSDSDLANCTIGSYNNDRALYAGRAAIAGGYGDTERDMVEYAHAN